MSDGKFTENSQVIYYYYPVLVTLQRFKLLLYTYPYTWFWIVKYLIMLDRNRQNTKNSITPSFYMFYRISYLIARGFDNFASRSVLLLTEKNQMKKSDHNFFFKLLPVLVLVFWKRVGQKKNIRSSVISTFTKTTNKTFLFKLFTWKICLHFSFTIRIFCTPMQGVSIMLHSE